MPPLLLLLLSLLLLLLSLLLLSLSLLLLSLSLLLRPLPLRAPPLLKERADLAAFGSSSAAIVSIGGAPWPF